LQVIVAESYARIFFRNSVATGELYPFEARERLIGSVKTGDVATVDFDADTVEINGIVHQMKPMGDVRPVIEAGGLFNYARQSGMISKS
jgi:3-isopropylmalate/(R)-2-methylmalate dehydratase small subunit